MQTGPTGGGLPAERRPSEPRLASGTRPRFDLGRGSVIVFSDDRELCREIRERLRDCGLVALPVATGLDAVLTLDRVAPRSAIISTTALGASADEIITFLDEAYPAVARVLLRDWADASMVGRISRWARTLDELTEIYQAQEETEEGYS